MVLKDFTNMTKDKKHISTLKTFIVIKCRMYRYIDFVKQTKLHYFNTHMIDILSESNIRPYIQNTIENFKTSIEESKEGSDWIFQEFIKFNVASTTVKSALVIIH